MNYEKTQKCTGWLVDCPALDYDDKKLQTVKKDINNLQENHKLGDAEIYRSSQNSYHVYFFQDNQTTREEELEVINDAEFVDQEFKEFQNRRDQTRMRIRGKHKDKIEHQSTVTSSYTGSGRKPTAEHMKRTLERMV